MTTDQPAIDRIPIGHTVNYAVRGLPEIADEYNSARTITPIEITLVYRAAPDSQLGRISAYVKGWWMEDGKRIPMDKPVGRWLYGGPEAWPAWLAKEARLHDPAAVSAVPSRADAWLAAAEAAGVVQRTTASPSRADTLRSAADRLESANPDRDADFSEGVDWARDELRRMAAEGPQS